MKEFNFNNTQSPFDPSDNTDKEYLEFIEEILDGITFVKNLTNSDRPRLKDLERKDFIYENVDSYGKPIGTTRTENKIEPDISNPHILEDMDYFRQSAIHFEQHGLYTLLTPNSHPYSEYTNFWREEKRRCLEGYVRDSDGEWIPGYYYWYLNYSRIQIAVEVQSKAGSKNVRGNRIEEFAKVWDGDYFHFHYVEKAESEGKFGSNLKTRGRGYSFKGGAKPARNFTLIKGSSNFMLAYDSSYLTGDGIWGKAVDNLDWIAKHTPWPRLRIVNKQSDTLEFQGGYRRKGSEVVYGSKALMSGIITRHNYDKARGIRGKYAAFEEAGKYPKLLDVWGIAESSYKQGNITFGYMECFGTGGSEEAAFEALENLWRHPHSYNILGLPNIYDLNVNPDDEVGFFMPEYLNREFCIDENGNSDVIKALAYIYQDRVDKKNNSDDPFAIVREKAERPITPTEAMMRKTGNHFPVYLLTEFLTKIRVNQNKFTSENYVVDLNIKNGEVNWVLNPNNVPIRKYPHDNSMKTGSVELFTLPKKNAKGKIDPNRYIASCDPYVVDGETSSSSLGSAFILDLWTDTIVAEYTGRPHLAKTYFETLRRLCILYNAKLGYEKNKNDIYEHFYSAGSLYYLATTPDYLYQKDLLQTRGSGNNAYGVPATAAINALGLRLQAEWMEEKNPQPIVEEIEGVMTPRYLLNYEKLKTVGYIEEAIKYNPDNNFDRVSSFNVLMIYRTDWKAKFEKKKDNRIKRKSGHSFFKNVFRQNGQYSLNAITK